MKDGFIKIGAASPTVRVGAVNDNCTEMIEEAKNAVKNGAKLLVFPEMSIVGATAGDLVINDTVIRCCEEAVKRFIEQTAALDLICFIGTPVMYMDKLYNCAAAVSHGKLLGLVPKTYISASEARWYASAPEFNAEAEYAGQTAPLGAYLIFENTTEPRLRIACEIGDDMCASIPPSSYHAACGANVIVNLSASPETSGSSRKRLNTVAQQSARVCGAYVYANAGSGESGTDLVFSAHNILADRGEIIGEALPFACCSSVYAVVDISAISYTRRASSIFVSDSRDNYGIVKFSLDVTQTMQDKAPSKLPFVPSDPQRLAEECEHILEIQSRALCARLIRSCSKKLVIGVSGGLDSTLAMLVCAKAADIAGLPRDTVLAVTMPCFGTTARTKSNAERLSECLGAEFKEVDISESVRMHLRDIGHDGITTDVTYENSQARERTQVLMDIANSASGLVVGTGDLSELVLGWATYNGDHMSMYGVNSSIPKTLIRYVVEEYAKREQIGGNKELAAVLYDILDTPVSPELLPPKDGVISQRTEELVGPYELHDFFIYHTLVNGFGPGKIFRLAKAAFCDSYSEQVILGWLKVFARRFINQQFKRSCQPDGVKVGLVSVSPRGALVMPSDASWSAFERELEELKCNG